MKRQPIPLVDKVALLKEYDNLKKNEKSHWIETKKANGYPKMSTALLCNWRKSKDSLFSNAENLSKKSKKMRLTVSRKFGACPELEELLYQEFVSYRADGTPITYSLLSKTATLIRESNKAATWFEKSAKLKFGIAWIQRFMKRFRLSMRRGTHVAQALPDASKVSAFLSYIRFVQVKHRINLHRIINVDETAVFFDLAPSRTIDIEGRKHIWIKSDKSGKLRITVVLAVAADGTKLPPVAIINPKKFSKYAEIHIPHGIVVWEQAKAWMTTELFQKYIKEIIVPYLGGALSCSMTPSLFCFDSFRGHTANAVTQTLELNHITRAVIPGGCTSVAQPLDVGVNAPFKAALRHLWTESLVDKLRRVREGEQVNDDRMTLQKLLEWVMQTWNAIPSEIVSNSFHCLETELNNNLPIGVRNQIIMERVRMPDPGESQNDLILEHDLLDIGLNPELLDILAGEIGVPIGIEVVDEVQSDEELVDVEENALNDEESIEGEDHLDVVEI